MAVMRGHAEKWLGRGGMAAIVVTLLLAGNWRPVHALPRQQDQQRADSEALTTTEKDQTDLAVTVYNSNLALVRDVRQIHLSAGLFPLKFEDVAASINPATVHFRSLTERREAECGGAELRVRLARSAEAAAEICGARSHSCARRGRSEFDEVGGRGATLLSDNNNGPVWKIGNEIVTGMPAGWYRFPGIAGKSLQPANAGVDAR